jgi:hypothetical protein
LLLKLQETKKDNLGRKAWKLRLIRQLYEAGYNQTQVLDYFTRDRITALSLPQLESLGEALLDFAALSDLTTWLENQGQQ